MLKFIKQNLKTVCRLNANKKKHKKIKLSDVNLLDTYSKKVLMRTINFVNFFGDFGSREVKSMKSE